MTGLVSTLRAAVGDPFRVGSVAHAGALAGTAVAAVTAVAVGRLARRAGPTAARRVDRAWAACLVGAWLVAVAYGLMPCRRSLGRSMPVQVCDVVCLAAPLGVLTRRRTPRAVAYFWGLGLSSQAFVTPVLALGPVHPGFWAYWLPHAALVSAAAYDVFARRYRPTWRDWRLAAAAAVAYAAVAFAADAALGTNFGYLGSAQLGRRTLIEAFGPWPTRVPWMVLTACGVMALLALPWRRNRHPSAGATRTLQVAPTAADPLRSAA